MLKYFRNIFTRVKGEQYYPKQNETLETGMVEFAGWVFPAGKKNITITADGKPLRIMECHDMYRPDIAKEYPRKNDAERSGFYIIADTAGIGIGSKLFELSNNGVPFDKVRCNIVDPAAMALTPNKQIIVLGHPRSGTSLVASLISCLGINMGEKLGGATFGNARGNWEDADVIRITHGILLENKMLSPVNDIAICFLRATSRQFISEELSRKIISFINSRNSKYEQWGCKFPSTTLAFSTWKYYVPNARILAVFRSPEEVMDSIYRYHNFSAVHKDPSTNLKSWVLYNSILLKLLKEYGSDRIFAGTAQEILAKPEAFKSHLRDKFSLKINDADLGSMFSKDLFHSLPGKGTEILMDIARTKEAELVEHSYRLYEQLKGLSTIKG